MGHSCASFFVLSWTLTFYMQSPVETVFFLLLYVLLFLFLQCLLALYSQTLEFSRVHSIGLQCFHPVNNLLTLEWWLQIAFTFTFTLFWHTPEFSRKANCQNFCFCSVSSTCWWWHLYQQLGAFCPLQSNERNYYTFWYTAFPFLI